MLTAEDIQDDLERLDYDDPEIKSNLEKLRQSFKAKGLPYHELIRSKSYGTIKYLLVELHDNHGTVLITDLDTNQTHRFVNPTMVRKPDRVRLREWIAASNRS